MNLGLSRLVSKKISRGAGNSNYIGFARLVAFISVMLGSMALIISLSVLEGFDYELHENAARFTSHISLGGSDRLPLPEKDNVMKVLPAKYPEITSISPLAEKECLIKSPTTTEGIVLRGVDRESFRSGVRERMVASNFDFGADTKGIIISRRLADKMKLDTGAKVTVFTVSESDQGLSPDATRFAVSGIYETGMAKYDDVVAFCDIATATKLFRLEANSVTGYEIYVRDPMAAPHLARSMTETLGYPFFALSMQEQNGSMFAWIDLQKKPIPIVLGLISLVAVLNIITSLLLTIVEKTHTIGILRALGMKSRAVVSVFIFKGTALAFWGSVVGCAVALLFCILQSQFGIISLKGEVYFLDELPVRIVGMHYLIVLSCSTLLGFIATLVPALVSTGITPIRAIRFK